MSKARCGLCSGADRLIHLFDSRLNNAEKLRINISQYYALNIHSCDLFLKYACVKCCLQAINSSICRKTSTSKCRILISPGGIKKAPLPRDEALESRFSTENKAPLVPKAHESFGYSEDTTKMKNEIEAEEDSTIPLTAIELFKNMQSNAQVVLDQVTAIPLVNSTSVAKNDINITLGLIKYKYPFIEVTKADKKIDYSKLSNASIASSASLITDALDQTHRNKDTLLQKTIASKCDDKSITEFIEVNDSKRRRSSSESSAFPVVKKKAPLLVPYTIKLECPYCGDSFHRQSRLDRHIKQHSKCIVCKKTHRSDEALFKHLKEVCHKSVEANQPVLQLERINEDTSVVMKYKGTFSFHSLLKHEIQLKDEPVLTDHLNSSTDKNENEKRAVCNIGKDVQIDTTPTCINETISENFTVANNDALSQDSINLAQANQNYLTPTLHLLENMINMLPATGFNAPKINAQLPSRIRVKSLWELK